MRPHLLKHGAIPWVDEMLPNLPQQEPNEDFMDYLTRLNKCGRELFQTLERELTTVNEQRDRLDDQLDHILLRLGRTQERMIDAERQRDRLEAEIRLTIMENVHLADGDVCTLKRLKDAIGFEFNEALQPLKTTEL
jgi:chromosome segregation ATPase